VEIGKSLGFGRVPGARGDVGVLGVFQRVRNAGPATCPTKPAAIAELLFLDFAKSEAAIQDGLA
jgi:hypothetical protein